MSVLTGLSAFPITPANEYGEVCIENLCSLIERMIVAGVDSIGLLGSTGTYMYLNYAERKKAIEAAHQQIKGRVPLIVGVSALRTDDAVKLAQDAKSLGATVGLLAPVSYTSLTQDEVFEHYASVARDSHLPICIYDNPGTTHFNFSDALITRLSRVTGIVGIKNALPADSNVEQHILKQRASVPPEFSCGYSGDWKCSEALLKGADVWYSVLGGVFPELCVSLTRASERKDTELAHKLNGILQPVWSLFQRHGSLRVVYEMLNQLSLSDAVLPRPLLPLNTSIAAEIAVAIRAISGATGQE